MNIGVIIKNEINKKAIQCYEQNHYKSVFGFGNIPPKNFGDITLVKPEDVPDHNFFMAGFPCQAFSLAGKRLGIEDVRGQVIYYIMKILEEKRPEHVLLENVRGLLSWNKGELFNWIIRELKKMYSTVQYKILNSKDYGVPQNRERIFIYATNREVPFGWNFIPKKQELKLKLKDMLEDNPNSKYTLTKSKFEHYNRDFGSKGKIQDEEGICSTLNKAMGTGGGNIPLVDKKYYLSKDQFKYASEYRDGKPFKQSLKDEIAGCITSRRPKRACADTNLIIVHSKQPRTSKTGKGGTGHLQKEDGTSYCLDKGNSQYIEYQNNIRVLTPLECFRLQGFKDGEINLDNLSNTAIYELAGNGWTLTVVAEIESKIFNHLIF